MKVKAKATRRKIFGGVHHKKYLLKGDGEKARRAKQIENGTLQITEVKNG